MNNSMLLSLGLTIALGCASGTAAPARPAATPSAPEAGASDLTGSPAQETSVRPTPAPRELPRAYTSVAAKYQAMLERQHEALAAAGNDCPKLAATLSAFTDEPTTRTTTRSYFVAEASLTDAERAILVENPPEGVLNSLAKTIDGHLKCLDWPAYSVALRQSNEMLESARAD